MGLLPALDPRPSTGHRFRKLKGIHNSCMLWMQVTACYEDELTTLTPSA
jgi:hypothetical protein